MEPHRALTREVRTAVRHGTPDSTDRGHGQTQLQDEVAPITGGTQGIGRGTAEAHSVAEGHVHEVRSPDDIAYRILGDPQASDG